MSPDLRCFAKTTKREERVLLLILRDYSIEQIARITNSTTTTIKTVRRSLLRRYKAKNLIHLVVVTSLESKYYDVLVQSNQIKQKNFEQEELKLASMLLQGKQNEEIAGLLKTSVKSVEYKRAKFKRKLGIEGAADFVRKCIEYRILILTPIEYSLRKIKIGDSRVRTHSILPSSLTLKLDIDTFNPTGFIYFDYLNRFCYNGFVEDASFQKSVDLFLTALFLTDFPSTMVGNNFYSKNTIAPLFLRSMYDVLFSKKPLELVEKEVNSKRMILFNDFKPVWPITYSFGQRFLILKSLSQRPLNVLANELNLTENELQKNIEQIHQIWGSQSSLGVLVTFLHLNYLEIEAI